MLAEHEKLEVYRSSLASTARIEGIATALPAEHAYLRLQLRRAFTSILLNIAEGAGEFSPADKARFYRIARRSENECMAILDIVHILRPRTANARTAKGGLKRVASMLTAMVTRMAEKG